MKKILVIPGDGIGPEIMREAHRLLQAITRKYNLEFSLDFVDWGAERFLRTGEGIPIGELERIPKFYDAILFGALGDPRIPDMAHGRAILLGLRTGLDLYINLRPIKLIYPKLSVLKSQHEINIIIFRENTEDLYLAIGGSHKNLSNQEITIDESIHTYQGVHRIISAAFEYAKSNLRKQVTLVDKSNAIKFGGSLWQRVFYQVAQAYPEIKNNHMFVDVAAMRMVQTPEIFDIIVTSNLFGDILSDLGAGLVGGLGLAASANMNPNTIPLFEPVHGSAPDIAGLNQANPFAMFMCISMMLDYFNCQQVSKNLEASIITAIKNQHTTKDLGGVLSTSDAADYVIANL